ncbi:MULTISPECIES: D-arabinono-1,4-lactone oxidase [Pseudomonas]|uniref:D-arabinono-1,4-lactone oxidase n=1 Tax=Pseudomonas TaxID=286 RepID=UPI00091A3FEE|nr:MULTISPECIES: D-arabinono-1,4-lactone oxidase [Pseudomonas]MDB6443899.1 FAD-binding protein [Pseudomonas sp. 21TX0197]MDT8904713.1 D-arabinono-1,4-lactone oxidase [Pseudomonas prosekii]ROO31647.1 FAD-linked oxidoreductase [Pseudomonas sp. 7SR1]SFX10193.1 FAD-linked oxidoreductase [Pseudomonas sp. NFACC43]SFX11063.1 FAD-linked oxidoreductase [Pseudomonas sp. NFACC47-1]
MTMDFSRRRLLQQAGVVAAFTALGSQGALADLIRAPRLIPWRNWSGAQSCLPAARLAPKDLDELVQLVKRAEGRIRPVGSGHSFSALVPTDGTLLSLSHFSGLLDHDAASLQAEFGGGTPMSRMGPALKAVGQALLNMADVDYQTLAGAIATSTHGTGKAFGSYASQVVGLQLVTARGEVLDCDARRHPDVFQAARVSLGALGLVTRVRLQNRAAYRLRERQWVARTEELLEDVPTNTRDNQHWEMQVVTHSDYALSIALNETTDPATPPVSPEEEGGNEFVTLIEKLDKYGSDFPATRRTLLNSLRLVADFDDRVGDSYDIYANARTVRFNEMEYSVPAEHGPACLREILALIRDKDLRTWFPIEYRYVKADDIALSMFEGRDSCSISVHQHYQMDHHNFFAAIEPIFWKYQGRPHWGKLHSLNARTLQALYPRWNEFAQVRQALDPDGKFLNGHLSSILGVS